MNHAHGIKQMPHQHGWLINCHDVDRWTISTIYQFTKIPISPVCAEIIVNWLICQLSPVISTREKSWSNCRVHTSWWWSLFLRNEEWKFSLNEHASHFTFCPLLKFTWIRYDIYKNILFIYMRSQILHVLIQYMLHELLLYTQLR